MPTLYVTTPGARIEKEYKRIIVVKDDELLFRIPLFRIDQIVLVGSVGITTPAMQALLHNGTGLTIINHSGRLLGRLMPPTLKNIYLRQRQYQRGEESTFCLELAKAFIYGKIRNAATMVTRMRRRHQEIDQSISIRLRQVLKLIKQIDTIDSLRGLEGRAARLYFLAFRQCLHPDWKFGKRSHHPPRDQVNALLGLTYTLLHENILTALEVVGLDPYAGYLHTEKYGRPALALDLMEEFRHIIADSVVLQLVNRRILTPTDYVAENGNFYLKKHALRKYFKGYQHRIQTEVIHPQYQKKLSYQKIFEVQARLLRKVIEGEEESYTPFLSR